MEARNRPRPRSPLLTFPPSPPSESRFTQTFPLRPSRFGKIITHLPLVFIFSILAISFYAYFLSLVVTYLLLDRHSHWKGFTYAAVYLWLAGGCATSVAVAYWRSGGDVPGHRRGGPSSQDLEFGERKPLETCRTAPAAFVLEDDEPGESAGLLSQQEMEDAEDERLEREENEREARKNRHKLQPRDARTRGEKGHRSTAMDMVEMLRDFDGPPEPAERDEAEWGPRIDGAVQVKSDGKARFCRKCQIDKPDRTHHCSSCGKCVLKMDHHCPWLGGACVGHNNYKAFLLFLWYGGALGAFVGTTTILELMSFVDDSPDNYELAPISWALVMILGGVFGFCMTLFGAYHLYLAIRNRTTIESMERGSYSFLPADPSDPAYKRYKTDDSLTRAERRRLQRAADTHNVYDMGARANLAQIFGGWESKWLWATPFGYPPGDGTTFPVNREKLRKLREVTTAIRLKASSGAGHSDDSD